MQRTLTPSWPALAAIGFMALTNLVRGSIHVFLPDSGAHSIAGLDISAAPEAITFLLASVGVGQIGLGAIDAYVLARQQSLVRPLLVLHVFQTALAVLTLFVLKPPPAPVPGQWFNLALGIVLAGIAAFEFCPEHR